MAAKLNEKQRRFAAEYLVDMNATQAAIRAGYSEKTAYSQGQRLLKHAEIQKLLDKGREKLQKRLEITQERVLEEMAKIAFANLGEYFDLSGNRPVIDLSQITPEQAAALSEIQTDTYIDGTGDDAKAVLKVKIKLHDKQKALVDIGKHLGMFKDRLVHEGDAANPVRSIIERTTDHPYVPPGARQEAAVDG